MIQLRKLPEAFREGWAAFRSTLFVAPRTTTMVFHRPSPPEDKVYGPFINGDLWINNLTLEMHYYLSFEKKWNRVGHTARTDNLK